MRPLMRIVVALAAVVLTSLPVSAQAVSGTINGLVTDPAGAAIPNVNITVANTNTGVVVKVTTNESGFYAVPNLIPGVYSVQSEKTGFKRYEKTGIALNVDSVVRVDCMLAIGQVSESVTVTSEAAVLKTEKADLGGVIGGKTLTELPVLGRNVSSLVAILPGALAGGAAFIGENPSSDTNGFVNGMGSGNNYHQLDGIDNQETIQGVAMVNPAMDSLQELKITTNSYDAEFGQVAGAVFQASTKSGTNEHHGSLYEYVQNDKFFARNSFTQATTKVAPWRWNEFGGSLGGPIKKDKLFFFGDWQGLRSRQGSTLQFGLPTAAMKTGDFSSLASQYPIYDPLTGDANGKGRTMFGNNTIPSARLNPAITKLVQFLPDPNTADTTFTRNYTKSGSFVSNTDAVDGRVDYNYSQNSRFFARYTFLRSVYDAPPVFGNKLGGPGFGPQAEVGGTRTQNLSTNFTRVIKTNLIAEFRVGFSRFRSNLAQNDVGLKTAQEIGIPGINKGDVMTDGLPQMSWEGPIFSYWVGNPYANFFELEQSIQYTTNWSSIKSSHTLKWGLDLRPKAKLQRIDKSLRGAFSFARQGTASGDSSSGNNGLGFATFLLGWDRTFSRGAYIRLPIEFQDRHGAYFQDQWRVSPKLTLTLGLRWEYFSPTYSEGSGREVNFDFNTAEMVFASLGSINKYAGVSPSYRDFAPRFGLAYTVSPKTVFRIGYGRSYAINTGGANFGTYCCQWPIGDNQALSSSTLYNQLFPLSQGPPDPSITTLVTIPSSGRLKVPDGQFVMGRPFNDQTTSQDAWNVTIQQQLSPTMTFEIGYVGNLVRHGWRTYNANPSVPGSGTLVSRKKYGTLYGLSQWIDTRSSEGNVGYNSMQMRVDKRFSGGYQFMASYTWQKTIADNYVNPFNRGFYRGLSGPAMWLTLSHVWELPFGPRYRIGQGSTGVARGLMEGWQFSGITQIQDGGPLSPGMNANTLNTDYAQRPDRVASGFVSNPSPSLWYDPTAFKVPAAYTFGNSGTGILHGPGFWVANFALDKSVYFKSKLNERTRVVFRWQLFNAFNHKNLGNPNTTIDSATAGLITSMQQTPRRMQLGLHLYF